MALTLAQAQAPLPEQTYQCGGGRVPQVRTAGQTHF